MSNQVCREKLDRRLALEECRRMMAGDENVLYLASTGTLLEAFWRDLIPPGGGQLGRRFFALDHWCSEVLRSSGRPGREVGRLGMEAVIENIVLAQAAAGGIPYFSPVAGRPGFTRSLGRLFAELRQAAAGPDAFEGALRRAGRFATAGEGESVRLYRLYGQEIDRLGVWGPAERAALAWSALCAGGVSPELASPEILILEGLGEAEDLPPIQRKIIDRLAGSSKRIILIEGSRFSPEAFVLTAPDPAAELEIIALTARGLIESGQAGSPEEIALVLRDPAERRGEIRGAFRRAGLPLDFGPVVRLAEVPVFRAIMALLDLAFSGGEREACLNVIKSDYLDPGLGGRDYQRPADRIEEVLLGLGPFKSQAGLIDLIGRRRADPELRRAEEVVRTALRRADLPSEGNLATLTAALDRALTALNLTEQILRGELELAARDLAAWRALRSSLAEVASVSGERTYSLSEFRELVVRCGDATGIPATGRAAGGVRVLAAHEAGGLSFRTVFVAGLTEGEFPSAPGSDWILPEPRRRELARVGLELDLPSAFGAREKKGFLSVARAATDRLYLSSYRSDAGGGERHQSSLLTDFIRLKNPAPWPEVPEYSGGVGPFQPGIRAEAERWSEGGFGSFDGLVRDSEVLEAVNRDLGPDRIFSVSRLGPYGQCPFIFFCREVLGLEAPEEVDEGLDPRVRGDLSHRVLFRFFSTLAGPKGALLDPTLREEHQRLLESVAVQVFAEHEEAGGYFHPGLWRLMRRELLGSLRAFLDHEIERAAGGSPMVPAHFEVGFGLAAQPGEMDPISRVEPLRVSREAGEILFRGRIDRIDLDPVSRQFIVYDYKTGSTPKVKDLLAGRDLQIPIYLMAAVQVLGGDWEPAGGGYYSLKDLDRNQGLYRKSGQILSGIGSRTSGLMEDEAFEETLNRARQFLFVYLDGIRRGDFPVRPSENRCPSYCHFQEICRYDRHRVAAKIGGRAG